MQAFTAWVQDKKNMPIVLAATGIVFALAILLILKMNGFIGAPKQSAIPTMPAAPAPGSPQPGMPAGEGSPPPAGPQPGMPAGEMPGGPPAAPGATPPQGGAPAVEAKLAPMLPYRKDPFMPLYGMPRKADVLAALLPSLSHPRLAPASIVENPLMAAAEDILPPQPFRRMSGVLWNGKVSAILETNGETDVVRPGMELTRGNSRVRIEAITQDSIILKTLDTKMPFTIRVNMAGSVVNSGTGGPGNQQVYSGPGGPTIRPNQPINQGGPVAGSSARE